MWKEIGKACGWKQPRAPSVRMELFDDERATEAVLNFLRVTWDGCMVFLEPPEEEGGPGRPRMCLSFIFPLPFFGSSLTSGRN